MNFFCFELCVRQNIFNFVLIQEYQKIVKVWQRAHPLSLVFYHGSGWGTRKKGRGCMSYFNGSLYYCLLLKWVTYLSALFQMKK
nr:MAG TPA: hypothetical protein [Caudoviricetes sp.]